MKGTHLGDLATARRVTLSEGYVVCFGAYEDLARGICRHCQTVVG